MNAMDFYDHLNDEANDQEWAVIFRVMSRRGLAWECSKCGYQQFETGNSSCCGKDSNGECIECDGCRTVFCDHCSGSGEGFYDGSRCDTCRGEGEVPCTACKIKEEVVL